MKSRMALMTCEEYKAKLVQSALEDGLNLIGGHHYQRCLRCYCWQEMCPEGAISFCVPLAGAYLTACGPGR